MKYASTKTYGANLGISCAFRQWRAKSHCNKLHGYALEFKFVFGAATLDDCNWVMDFGGLKSLKEELVTWFDHKTVVANDDPLFELYQAMSKHGMIDIVILQNVGCEAFAQFAHALAVQCVRDAGQAHRIKVLSCEVREHGANSAIYKPYA